MNNQHTKELSRMLQEKFCNKDDKLLLSEWLCKFTMLKEKKFSLDRYPFQKALIDDPHPNSVTVKCSQVGVSEIYQRVALAMLARAGSRKGIYAYPDDEMRKKNVQTRVQPLWTNTKEFHKDYKEAISSIQLLQMGTSYLYMTGAKVGDATSTDADFAFLDEYDLHNMAIAALFGSRLQNSDWRIRKYFSTPTYTNYGVDALYATSDQTSYLIKCDSCNHWQFPLFEPKWLHIKNLPGDINDLREIDQGFIDRHNLGIEESYVCCSSCRTRLDLGRVDNRTWVSKFPSRTGMRGWKMNPFSVATRPPKDIFAELQMYKTNDFIRGFNNSVLGEPEDASQNRLSEADIRACIGSREVPDIDKTTPTWIGLDMGHSTSLLVGQGDSLKSVKIVLAERVPLGSIRERIVQVCATYNVIGGVVDRHPESQTAKDLWELTSHRVVPAEYRGSVEIAPKILVGTEDVVEYVQVDRTTLLDEAARAVRNKAVQFNGYGGQYSEIIEHFRNMVREEAPETPATWKKLSQNDHFFHSLGMLLTAMKLAGYTEARYGSPQTMLGFATIDMTQTFQSLLGNSKADQWQHQDLYPR